VGTRALPEIWENLADFQEKYMAFGAAAEGLAAVAGDGLDPMRAAFGPVGAACGACHDATRPSSDLTGAGAATPRPACPMRRFLVFLIVLGACRGGRSMR
jgi:hypothetical protein